MQAIVDQINSYVWSPALVYLCLAAGLFFSILTRFVQVRLFAEMIRLLFSSKESDRGISSFQALSVSLSGRVGTGNIAGVAAAIGFGGPGAVFWMWIVAFLGAATAYVESALGQIYKEEARRPVPGRTGLLHRESDGAEMVRVDLSRSSTIVAVGLLLPTVQSNAIGNAAELAFGGAGKYCETGLGEVSYAKLVDRNLIVVTVLGIIIFGGVKRIAHVHPGRRAVHGARLHPDGSS